MDRKGLTLNYLMGILRTTHCSEFNRVRRGDGQ